VLLTRPLFGVFLDSFGSMPYYEYRYVLLQLESYALLVGSVGLFIILGIAMFATQKIDWYKKKE
jgi:inner membrane protein involved in colicin E2 resistance